MPRRVAVLPVVLLVLANTLSRRHQVLRWFATAVMGAAVVAMFWTI